MLSENLTSLNISCLSLRENKLHKLNLAKREGEVKINLNHEEH